MTTSKTYSKENPFWSSKPGEGLAPVSPKVSFPELDHAVMSHWEAHNVFQRTISERPLAGKGDFVAYDGPPGTNGTPHIGHMMQSALKDLWPRYKTMQGHRVLRKAGWDTHGLPIELTAEKELGFKTKRDIEAYGVEKYIDYCRSTVYRYRDEWIKAIKRIGRFLDTDDDYATFRKEYIETDWWVLKQAWDKGLLYQDRRIMPYCSRCGTSLSQHEVAQGYKDVQDISIYAKFPVVGQENTYFVAWTTTPWTLLSNVALAVNPDLVYVTIDSGEKGELKLLGKSSDIGRGVESVDIVTFHTKPFDRVIIAENRVLLFDGDTRVLSKSIGKELAGLKYVPLWDFQKSKEKELKPLGQLFSPGDYYIDYEKFGHKYKPGDEVQGLIVKQPFQVIADDYVTADDGSGIVHLALYGADDFRLIRQNGLPLVQNVDLDGKCTPNTGQFAGRWFKEDGLDVDILKDLASRGLLFGKEKITHSYPHCYRCDTPLMYFAKSGWFLKTSALKENMLEANKAINWYPEHIKEGRFGNWLENNVDWNISRDRYWGSPIPIWECDSCGNRVCVGSFKDLEGRLQSAPPTALPDSLAPHSLEGRLQSALPADFDPHKPGIDNLEMVCEKCGGKMRRTPEVLDCWFNAGIMPWGQYGKETFGNTEAKEQLQHDPSRFPADFICEAIDQTRGWFYTMLATSVLITTRVGRAAEPDEKTTDSAIRPTRNDGQDARPTRFEGGVSSFKNVICTEHVSDAAGQKMSKSKGNVIDPIGLCEKYGADAVRWTFYSTNPWTARRFSEADLGEVLKQVLIPYWNCYSFFVTYARVDGWKPDPTLIKPSDNPLDRWIVSRLEWLKESVTANLNNYNVLGAAESFSTFIDELTNWYIRRSRRRFWKSEDDADKQNAYQTLYTVLTSMNRMLAPFIPFVAEVVYQNLERGFDAALPDSVHLVELPPLASVFRDLPLEEKMETARRIVTLAHSVRAENKVRVRQPLQSVVVAGLTQELEQGYVDLILDELNVKSFRLTEKPTDLFKWKAKGDFKTLGPKFGAKVKEVAGAITAMSHDDIERLVIDGKIGVNGVDVLREDIQLSQEPVSGYWVRSEGSLTVGVTSEIDTELTSEWLAREFIHHIQNMRRDAGLEVTDRIAIEYSGDRELRDAIVHHIRYISGETLAESVVTTLEGETPEVRIGERVCRVKIRPFK